jgi:hypothetical protein
VTTELGSAIASGVAVSSGNDRSRGSRHHWTARQRSTARAVRLGGPRPRRAGGATGRSPRGHGDRFRSGARRPAGTGPGSSPAPPPRDAAPYTSSNGWSPSRPGRRRQRRSPGSSPGWTSCESSPPRSSRARCTTGTCSPSPRPSTKSSAPFTGAARPYVHKRCGRGGDTGVTWGAITLRASLPRCHPGPAVSNRPGSAPSHGDGHLSVSRRRPAGEPMTFDDDRGLRALTTPCGEARRAEQLEDHIRRVVNAAPPLTAEQRDRLALLLHRSSV